MAQPGPMPKNVSMNCSEATGTFGIVYNHVTMCKRWAYASKVQLSYHVCPPIFHPPQNNRHQPLLSMVKRHYHPLLTMINHHQPSCTIIHHHQLSALTAITHHEQASLTDVLNTIVTPQRWTPAGSGLLRMASLSKQPVRSIFLDLSRST